MSKKAKYPQSRRHIMIYDEDWKFLEMLYGPGGAMEKIGISTAIKEIVHAKVMALRAQHAKSLDLAASRPRALTEGDLL
jgi:hypothetical protein